MRSIIVRLVTLSAMLAWIPGASAQETCPAWTPLSLTCENGTCDRLLGENATNCPGDCLDGRNHVKPYYSMAVSCPATRIFRPETVANAQWAMRRSVLQGRRVRVVGTAHTASKAICVEDGNVISTEKLTRILGLGTYKGQPVLNVEAGAHIWDIAEYLHARGKALGYNIPGYGDISIGGFLAVGGHGSNAVGSATVSSLVVSIDKMDPQGRITTHDAESASPNQWRALRGDLGMLGMTVRLRLRVREQFNVRQRILSFSGAELFRPGGMRAIADGCEYIFATYFNSVDRLDVTCGRETDDPPAAEDARMTLFIPDLPGRLQDLAVVGFQRGACDPETAQRLERLLYAFRQSQPWIEWTDADGQPQRATEAVGYSHRMVETTFRGLARRKFSNLDWEVALPESEIEGALAYVKGQLQEHQLYNPAIGVVIRADRAVTDTLLASAAAGSGVAAGERIYHLEFPIYFPYAFSADQIAAYQAPYVEMILYLIRNHRARPHLGKNRSDIFAHPVTLAANADRRALFQPFIDQMDPAGVFANDFLRQAGFTWPNERQDASSVRSRQRR
jgi:FAD/FMN-containing dehydrogenase